MRKIQKPQNVWENNVGQEENNNNNEIKDGECVKSGGVAVRWSASRFPNLHLRKIMSILYHIEEATTTTTTITANRVIESLIEPTKDVKKRMDLFQVGCSGKSLNPSAFWIDEERIEFIRRKRQEWTRRWTNRIFWGEMKKKKKSNKQKYTIKDGWGELKSFDFFFFKEMRAAVNGR